MRDAITGTPAASASRAPMPLVSSQTEGNTSASSDAKTRGISACARGPCLVMAGCARRLSRSRVYVSSP